MLSRSIDYGWLRQKDLLREGSFKWMGCWCFEDVYKGPNITWRSTSAVERYE